MGTDFPSAASRAASLKRLAEDKYIVEPDQEYTIEAFRPEDALPVVRCIYDVYGGDHAFDYVYDPEAVARQFTSGEQFTAVARTPKGDVLGMISLYHCPPWPGTFEGGQLMIMQNCRDATMGLKLCKYAATILASTANADAVYVEAVCTHVFTQYACRKNKYIECGLEVDAMPAGAFSSGDAQVAERTSMLLYFLVRNDRPHNVYLPESAKNLAQGVYDRLQLERTLQEGASDQRAEASALTTIALPDVGLMRLQVEKAGNDLAPLAAQAEQKLDSGAVQIILNLADPATPAAASELRARGYFLGGLMPLWFGTDGLLLQRLKTPPDFDAPKIGSAAGKDILRQVREDMERLPAPSFAWGEMP